MGRALVAAGSARGASGAQPVRARPHSAGVRHRAAPACHAHHITFRDHGGHTVLSNLVLLRDRHHRLVHYRGWKPSLDDDALSPPDSTGGATPPDPAPSDPS